MQDVDSQLPTDSSRNSPRSLTSPTTPGSPKSATSLPADTSIRSVEAEVKSLSLEEPQKSPKAPQSPPFSRPTKKATVEELRQNLAAMGLETKGKKETLWK